MSTQLKLRRGTTAQHSTFTGASGEITVDTSKKTLVIHDGSTAGGIPLATETAVNGKVGLTGNETVAGTKTFSSTISGSITGNAGTVTNGVYTSGDQSIGGVKTFSSPVTLSAGSAAAPAITTSGDTNTGIFFPAADTIAFAEGGVEVARFDSAGNFGINSTATALGTYRGAEFAGTTATTGGFLRMRSSNSSINSLDFTDLNGRAIFTTTSHPLRFGTADTERMRLDASGNLGLGVTPSAWAGASVNYYTMQFGVSAITNVANNAAEFVYNQYIDSGGTRRYISSNVATRYRMDSGHSWYTAPSGTAGNAISFTQAMTLDASGNLAVGTTTATNTANKNLEINGTGDSALNVSVGGTNIGYVYASASSMLVGSRQNVPLVFNTNATERARIDSSGNLLVGTTSFSYTPSQGTTIATGSVGSIGINHANGTSSGNGYMNFVYNTTAIGSITQSGTTAVLYNTTSDQRLKENIQDAAPASALIDALQVRQYDWKQDGTHQRYGFIAQELVTVAPEAVHQPADPEEMMAVDYSKLVPMLVKEIQSLRQRLAAAGI